MKQRLIRILIILAVVVLLIFFPTPIVHGTVVAQNEPVELEVPQVDLHDFAKEIQRFEGYYEGSLAHRNNNPGNLRYSPLQLGKKDGFAYFETYEDGYNALMYYLQNICNGESNIYHRDMDMFQFFNVYAPPSDNNQPNHYASVIIDRLQIDQQSTIGELCDATVV